MTESAPLQPERVNVEPVLALKLEAQCGNDPQQIAQAMGQAFGTLGEFAQQRRVPFAGPPRAIYTGYGPEGTKFTVVMPVAADVSRDVGEGPVTVGDVPGGKALRFTHRGPYPRLMQTYEQITAWMKSEGMLATDADWAKYMPMWEEYVNDPESTPEENLITNIYVPLH